MYWCRVKMFGYSPSVYYPKATDNELFNVRFASVCWPIHDKLRYRNSSLNAQAWTFRFYIICHIRTISRDVVNVLLSHFIRVYRSTIDEQFGLILDGIFGFGFKGEIRDPFLQIINQIKQCRSARIVSIDIPSGWEVDTGELTSFQQSIFNRSL